jgi:hypothetical protein
MRAKMDSEVESMQNGSIMRSERQRGPDVWEFRWREPGPDGRRKHRRIVIGSVIQFRDKDRAMRATSALRRDINMANVRGKGKPVTCRNWRITILSASLPLTIDGKRTPPSWDIEATCASGLFPDGAATH